MKLHFLRVSFLWTLLDCQHFAEDISQIEMDWYIHLLLQHRDCEFRREILLHMRVYLLSIQHKNKLVADLSQMTWIRLIRRGYWSSFWDSFDQNKFHLGCILLLCWCMRGALVCNSSESLWVCSWEGSLEETEILLWPLTPFCDSKTVGLLQHTLQPVPIRRSCFTKCVSSQNQQSCKKVKNSLLPNENPNSRKLRKWYFKLGK